MGRLEDLQCFARVVDARSFSGGARLLGSSKSAVSKQISRLESQLGTRLLQRSTRSLSTTPEGQRVYERALRLLEESQALDAELLDSRALPRGTLRLSTSSSFGNLQLTALLAGFCRQHPQLQLVLGLNDRYVDLAEEGFDLVLRLTGTPAPGLVARRLAGMRYLLCASPAYLQQAGEPATVAELAGHRCLRFGHLQAPERWRFRRQAFAEGAGSKGAEDTDEEQSVEVQGALRFESGLTVNSSESLRVAALAGMGLAVLPSYAISADLRAGSLRAVLPEWLPISGIAEAHSLYAVYLPSRQPSTKVRALIDYLLEQLGEVAPWDR